MTDFDPAKPDGAESIRLLDNRTRDNFLAIQERLEKEHEFPSNAAAGRGRHKFGVGNAAARAAAITAPVAGNVWWNSDTLQWEIYDGTAWRGVGAAVGDIKHTAHATGAADLGGGWIRADGRVLSQATYAKLFAVCGTAFNTGAEGGGNFRIPDLRGRVPLGHYQGGDGDGDYGTPGVPYGSKRHTLVTAEMPAHNHGGLTGNVPAVVPFIMNTRDGNGNDTLDARSANSGATFIDQIDLPQHTHVINSQGGNGAHENRQPSLTLVAHIYTGV